MRFEYVHGFHAIQANTNNVKCSVMKHTECPQNDLEYLTVKSTLYRLTTEIQILVRFALRQAFFFFFFFEVQGCRKSKCTKWPHSDIEHLLSKVPCI